jgi:hypothetical protein
MESVVDKTAAKALGLKFSPLRLYCNLASHTRLSNEATVDEFLSQLGSTLTLDSNDDKETQQRLDRLFTLQSFRDELRTFLQENGIDTALCDGDDNWNVFLSAYLFR